MTDEPPRERLWVVLRHGPLGSDEEEVLTAFGLRARDAGVRVRWILLGTASYAAEGVPPSTGGATTPLYVLENDLRGRGVRRSPERPIEAVTYAQLVTWLFRAEKVISFP